MIPSVIGAQVRRGIVEFLRTTFPITNPYFNRALDELLERFNACPRTGEGGQRAPPGRLHLPQLQNRAAPGRVLDLRQMSESV